MKTPLAVAERTLKYILPMADDVLGFVERNQGSSHIPPYFLERLDLLKASNWSEMYLDPRKARLASFLSVFSIKQLEIIAYNFQHATEEERITLTESLLNHVVTMNENDLALLEGESITEELQAQMIDFIKGLDDSLKAEIALQLQFMVLSTLVILYSTLSMMVYGRRLVDLVQRAMNDDEDAFFMAYHVDKTVLNLPYFAERYRQATSKFELKFLTKLAQVSEQPLLKKKIVLRKLWFTFAHLEDMELLYSLKREELLNLCQRLGVYGSSPDEKDVGGLNNRLRDYRNYQRTDYKPKKRVRTRRK